jgi:hypothetical protein
MTAHNKLERLSLAGLSSLVLSLLVRPELTLLNHLSQLLHSRVGSWPYTKNETRMKRPDGD